MMPQHLQILYCIYCIFLQIRTFSNIITIRCSKSENRHWYALLLSVQTSLECCSLSPLWQRLSGLEPHLMPSCFFSLLQSVSFSVFTWLSGPDISYLSKNPVSFLWRRIFRSQDTSLLVLVYECSVSSPRASQ